MSVKNATQKEIDLTKGLMFIFFAVLIAAVPDDANPWLKGFAVIFCTATIVYCINIWARIGIVEEYHRRLAIADLETRAEEQTLEKSNKPEPTKGGE